MITKIYNQKSPICYLYAIAYALQDKFGAVATDSEIEQYGQKALASKGRTGKQVIKFPELVFYMKKNSFCGYKISDSKTIFRANKWKTRTLRGEDIKKAVAEGYSLCFGLKIREGGFRNRVDKWGVYRPPVDSKRIDGHAVLLTQYGSLLCFVNSHGKDFGQKGFFYLDQAVMNEEIEYVEAVKFIPKYS